MNKIGYEDIQDTKPWNVRRSKREDGLIISSIKAPCLAYYGKYETALVIPFGNDGEEIIRILEGYDTKEDYLEGHEKYLNMSYEELMNFDYIG